MKNIIKDKIVNTLCKIILPFYSLIVVVLAIVSFFKFNIWASLGVIYLLPLFTWRFINFFYPLKDSKGYIAGATFSPWLSSYRIQEIYIKFPFLEKILMLVPFLFNIWLRAWGSKIGKRVLFTPNTIIIDRPGLDIGDNVYFGDKCYLSSHLVIEKDKKFFCIYKKIKIEDNSFIGAFSTFGPGSLVRSGSRLNAFSLFKLNSDKAETLLPS